MSPRPGDSDSGTQPLDTTATGVLLLSQPRVPPVLALQGPRQLGLPPQRVPPFPALCRDSPQKGPAGGSRLLRRLKGGEEGC